MKTIISKSLLVAGLALSMALTSCDDYLSNVPKGQKIPTTLEDFSTMLADEYNNCREDVTQAVILLNDRFVSAGNLSYYELWNANYYWDESADRVVMNKSDETTYYNGYAGISIANLIIENAPRATDATDAQRNQAMAQAKILRAMKYFTLVNYYAKTYNAATAANDGGVPLITSADVGAAYTQPSVQAIYDFILQDINEALPDLPEQPLNVLYAGKGAGEALAARVYLQMGNYQEALNHAGEALKLNDQLFDWVAFYNDNAGVLGDPDVYQSIASPMGHGYVENFIFCHGNNSYAGNDLQMREDRGTRFELGDAHFMSRWKIRTSAGATYYNPNLTGYFNRGGLTTTEVYLIQAECMARTGNVAGAMQVLNKVRQKRILPEYYQDLGAANADEAIDLIIKTKDDALVQTIVPFCDIRRLNLETNHARTLTKVEGGKSYSLAPTSHMWVMPFPQGAVENAGNGTITQNVEK
ncbi:MAG: RagB/SusD family nutrient uptake outer membrane protein [Muribaculaceae bacterium]|nr:RagB/SusD family nutrient uptake outer membrane protein [Muribaculaceae bacterium]